MSQGRLRTAGRPPSAKACFQAAYRKGTAYRALCLFCMYRSNDDRPYIAWSAFSLRNRRISSAAIPACLADISKCTHSKSRSTACSSSFPWLDISKKSPPRIFASPGSPAIIVVLLLCSISTLDPRLCAPVFRQVYLLLDPFHHERIWQESMKPFSAITLYKIMRD